MILFYVFFASLFISLVVIITFWRSQNPCYKLAKWVNFVYLILWIVILFSVKGFEIINASEQVIEDLMESWAVCSYILLVPNLTVLIYRLTKKLRLQKDI